MAGAVTKGAAVATKGATAVAKVGPFAFGQKIWDALSAWTIRNSGYQKIGLLREDLYSEDYPEIVEAIRRLPENETYLRLYRLKRALDLSLKHTILPTDQWTKPEEDVLYLAPYIKEVMAEMKEKKKWKSLY